VPLRSLLTFTLACGLLALPAQPAPALQLAGLLVGKLEPVQGKYRKGNVIRVHASFGRDHRPEEAYRAAMAKVGEMASAKGYYRVGVTKISDCGTLMMNGSIPVAVSCRVLAQMVGPEETAKPEKGRPVVYYAVRDLIMGNIRPEGT
jgi:hypothetical protein